MFIGNFKVCVRTQWVVWSTWNLKTVFTETWQLGTNIIFIYTFYKIITWSPEMILFLQKSVYYDNSMVLLTYVEIALARMDDN